MDVFKINGIEKRKIEKELLISSFGNIYEMDFAVGDYVDEKSRDIVYGYEPAYPLDDVLDLISIDQGDTIIDLGCGKGYAIYLLTKYPFKKISGIEKQKMLVETARRNIYKFATDMSRYEIISGSVYEWNQYDEYNYYFMFNPFDEIGVERIAKAIAQSAERKNEKKRVIYQYYMHINSFLSVGFSIIAKSDMTVILEYLPITLKKKFIDEIKPNKCENLLFYDLFDSIICYAPQINKVSVAGNRMFQVFDEFDGLQSLQRISEKLQEPIQYVIKVYEKMKEYIKGEYSNDDKNNGVNYVDFWINVTDKCNLSCPYCYIDKSSEAFEYDQIEKLIDKIYDYAAYIQVDKVRIRFAGGEPLLNKDVIDHAIKYVNGKKLGIHSYFGIVTNGTLIDDSIADWIAENNIIVAISLDGTEEYHNKTRSYINGGGSFEKVKRAIDILHNKGIHITVLTTVTDSNIECLEDLTRFLVGYSNINFRFSFEKCHRNKIPKLIQMQDQLIEKLNNCIDIMENEIINGNIGFSFKLCDINISKRRNKACGAGVSSFAFAYNNRMSTCGMNLENAKQMQNDMSIQEMIDSLNVNDIISVENGECDGCIWKSSCSGGCVINNYNYYKKYYKKSPYCKTFKKLMPRLIKLRGMKMYYDRQKVTR